MKATRPRDGYGGPHIVEIGSKDVPYKGCTPEKERVDVCLYTSNLQAKKSFCFFMFLFIPAVR